MAAELTALGVLAVTVQFRDLTGFLAVLAAVFPVRTFHGNAAFAGRMGTLRGCSHGHLPEGTLRLRRSKSTLPLRLVLPGIGLP